MVQVGRQISRWSCLRLRHRPLLGLVGQILELQLEFDLGIFNFICQLVIFATVSFPILRPLSGILIK